MTYDTSNTGSERRAGLLSRRFKQGFTQPSDWFEPDMRVVDADVRVVDADIISHDKSAHLIEETHDTEITQPWPTIPPAPAERVKGSRWATGASLAPSAPWEQEQALWEIIPSATTWGDSTLTEVCLASALRPPAEVGASWARWMGLGAKRKETSTRALTLEIAVVSHRARLFVRGPLPLVSGIFDHLAAAYRDIQRVVIVPDTPADADPLVPQINEGVSFAELHLESPAIFPLKLTEPGPNPLSSIFRACAHSATDAPVPLRIVSQLHIRPAPAKWQRRHQALLFQQRARRAAPPGSASGSDGQQIGLSLAFLTGMVALFLAVRGLLFLLWGVLLPLVVIFGSLGLVSTWRRWRLTWRRLHHEQEVMQKLSQEHLQACLRLYVLGPAEARKEREGALDRCIRAYGAYADLNRWKVGKRGHIHDLAPTYPPINRYAPGSARAGESLPNAEARYQVLLTPDQAFHPRSRWQRLWLYFAGDQARSVLGIKEVAALWHMPALADLQAYFHPMGELSFRDESQ